jgi:hypothetical protein
VEDGQGLLIFRAQDLQDAAHLALIFGHLRLLPFLYG